MSTLELEHCIGGFYSVPNALHIKNQDIISIAGAQVVISDRSDPHNQRFLRGHTGMVNCLTVCKNFPLAASAQLGDSANIYIWDLEKQKLKHKLCRHEHAVSCCAFTDDGRLFVSVGDHFDHQLFVWDIASGLIVANLQLTALGSSSIHQVTPDRRPPPQPTRVTASSLTSKSTVETGVNEGDITAVCWGGHARDIKRRETEDYVFATAGRNVCLWILTPSSGNLTQLKFNQSSNVRTFTTVAFTTDGEKCIAGTTSGDFAVFLVRTMVLEQLIPGCSHGVRSLCVSPSNDVYIGGGDGFLRVFRVSPRSHQYVSVKELVVGKDVSNMRSGLPITGIAVTPDNEEALVSNTDGTIYSITVNEFKQSFVSSSHSGPISFVSFPYGINDKFATCSPDDDTVRVWDLSSYDQLSVFSLAKSHPQCIAWAGECLCAGFSTGDIRFIDAYDGSSLWQLVDAHKGGTTAIATADLRAKAPGASSTGINLPPTASSSSSSSLSAITSNSLIISGGAAGELRVWDIKTRKLKTHMKEHSQAVTGVCVFGDNKHVLSGSRDKSISCVDIVAERRLSNFKGRASILNIDIFPDEKRIVTACIDKSITFWDLAVADPVRILLNAHDDQVTAIAVANDVDLFVSGGADHLVKLWTIDGKLINTFEGHSGPVNAIKFSPDDKQLISVGSDGNILIWNLF